MSNCRSGRSFSLLSFTATNPYIKWKSKTNFVLSLVHLLESRVSDPILYPQRGRSELAIFDQARLNYPTALDAGLLLLVWKKNLDGRPGNYSATNWKKIVYLSCTKMSASFGPGATDLQLEIHCSWHNQNTKINASLVSGQVRETQWNRSLHFKTYPLFLSRSHSPKMERCVVSMVSFLD